MKTRSIIMVLTLILAGGVAHAQDLGAGSIKLILNGQSYGGTLTAQANSGPTEYTWTLPNASGTLALESAGTGWSTTGNTLGSTGLLGTLNNNDVNLITNNTTRITMLGNTAAVVLPSQTALRLGDASGGEYVALMSPATVKTSGYNLIFPDSLPGGPNVRLQVESISGNNVYLQYSNPNTTGSIGYKEAGQTSTTQGATANDWTNVEGLNFYVGPNAIYSFEALIELTGPANQGIKLRFGTPFGLGAKGAYVAVAGTTIRYYVITLTDNNIVGFGNQLGNVDTPNNGLITGEHYVIKGFIETDGTTPANSVIQMLMLREDANEVTVTSKSSVQLITE